MKKKLLALLLACCMVFGMLPAVSAAEAQEFTRIPVDDPTDISGGTYLIYGTSSQVMEDGSASAFMTAEGASSTRLMSRNLPITNDTVTTDDRYCVWNLIEVDGGFLIQNAATSAYLYYGDGSGNAIYQTTDVELAGIWTVISNNNGWTLQEDVSGRQLSCNRFGSAGSYYLGYASYEADSTTLRSLEFFKLGASVTEPEDTEPVETEPVETKPIETEPVESEPVETEPVNPSEPEVKPDASGAWGDNVTWALYDTTLYFSGNGWMDVINPDTEDYPWDIYDDIITEAYFYDGITSIAPECFANCTKLTKVRFPSDLEGMHYGVFRYCTSLTTIDLPTSITLLQNFLFEGSGLTEIVIPDNITELGCNVFAQCTSLVSVTLPQGLKDTGEALFYGCTALTSVKLPDGLISIGTDCFKESSLTHITIPDSVLYIHWSAFENCTKLHSVDMSNSLDILSSKAFAGCSNLTKLDLPDSLRIIESDAFMNSGLVSLIVPHGVLSLEGTTFANCPNLELVQIPDTVYIMDEHIFDNSPKVTIQTYYLSHAHLYATHYEIPYVILEDEPNTPIYTISISCNSGGSVTAIPDVSPANRYVVVEMLPDSGYVPATIHYFCVNDPDYQMEFHQVSDTMLLFLMPAGDVELEIYFMPEECPFVDVKETDYFYSPVLWALTYDITSGVSANRFGPNNACTRAQVVTFLWAAAGRPEPTSYYNPFSDVKETDYFYKAVLWAVENGITSGMSATTFGSNNPCTRAQVVTFLWAAVGRPEPSGGYNPFTDVKETDYYYKAVLFAMEYGITSGMSATSFGSNNTCTRAHVVTFLYKTFYG